MDYKLKILIIVALIVILMVPIYFILFSKNKEYFTTTIQDYKKGTSFIGEKNTDFIFNYSNYLSETTSIRNSSGIELLLASFCFKTEELPYNFKTKEWNINNNSILEIIKENIPIRTSEIHDLSEDDILNSDLIKSKLDSDIQNLRNEKLDELITFTSSTNKDTDGNFVTKKVIIAPIFAIFIQYPYHIEHDTDKNKYYIKSIFFDNLNDTDFTPPYALYNDGIFDNQNLSNTNNNKIVTKLLFLFPMYHKTESKFYGYEYMKECLNYKIDTLEQETPDSLLKIKNNPELSINNPNENIFTFKGITDMIRFFNSNSIEMSNDSIGKFRFTSPIKFEISRDKNCFIRCKNSLPSSNSNVRIVCGCATNIEKEETVVNADITGKYNSYCKSNKKDEIENNKLYSYGFVYRVNENLINNVYKFIMTTKNLKELSESINNLEKNYCMEEFTKESQESQESQELKELDSQIQSLSE
jgi:hypothetical protein